MTSPGVHPLRGSYKNEGLAPTSSSSTYRETRRQVKELVRFFRSKGISLEYSIEKPEFMTVITSHNVVDDGIDPGFKQSAEGKVVAVGVGNAGSESLFQGVDKAWNKLFMDNPTPTTAADD